MIQGCNSILDEDYSLRSYVAVLVGNLSLTFRRRLLPLSSWLSHKTTLKMEAASRRLYNNWKNFVSYKLQVLYWAECLSVKILLLRNLIIDPGWIIVKDQGKVVRTMISVLETGMYSVCVEQECWNRIGKV